MAKLYTKTGDKGQTGLVGGKRISKGSRRIEAYGNVDELNAVLGTVFTFLDPAWDDLRGIVLKIQETLFVLGADLATPADHQGKRFVPRIGLREVGDLEKLIDQYDAKLPLLQNFILPSGGTAGALAHFARTVCRRAEREVARLSSEEPLGEAILQYLNRLSDFLFVLARTINLRQSIAEIPWMPKES